MAGDRLWIGAKERTPAQFAELRREAARLAAASPGALDGLAAFCLFVGYPRSGHSLVGSLIDAHRHAVLAHELDVLDFLDEGFGRDELLHVVLENSRRFTAHGRAWTGYDYAVPGQWQGRFEQVRVVGDKKGGRTVRRIHRRPELLDRLRDLVGVPLRFVHVTRNPWDNVATRGRHKAHRDLSDLADLHFALVKRVARLKERVGEDAVLDVRHEDLIADAPPVLRRICAFLGLDAPEDWVAAVAGILFTAPRRSRHEAAWPDGLVESIGERAARFPFLEGYRFDD